MTAWHWDLSSYLWVSSVNWWRCVGQTHRQTDRQNERISRLHWRLVASQWWGCSQWKGVTTGSRLLLVVDDRFLAAQWNSLAHCANNDHLCNAMLWSCALGLHGMNILAAWSVPLILAVGRRGGCVMLSSCSKCGVGRCLWPTSVAVSYVVVKVSEHRSKERPLCLISTEPVDYTAPGLSRVVSQCSWVCCWLYV